MTTRFFLDSNILIYATVQPDGRSDTARALLAQRGIINVHVLNEFANVARRKLRRSWPDIETALAAIRVLCPPPLPLTLAVHEAALRIAAQTGYQLFDAVIVASALDAGCAILFTDDMQDGRVIERRLTIRNPFAQAAT